MAGLSEETAERMIAAVATSKAHLTALQGAIRKLDGLPEQFAAHRQEFKDLKYHLQGNGNPGICKVHSDDIATLKQEANRSIGRREVLSVIIAFVLSIVGSTVISLLKDARPIPPPKSDNRPVAVAPTVLLAR